MPTWLVVLIVLAALLLLLMVWFVVMYNGLVRRRNQVEESWTRLDSELTSRHDLVMNLVQTVKGAAPHESATFDGAMEARYTAMNAEGPAERGTAEGELSQAVGRLLALADRQPGLRADQNFTALEQELTATEERIAQERRTYNANVRDLNTAVSSFPRSRVAEAFHIGKAQFLEADEQERTAPKAESTTSSGRAGAAPVRGDRPTGQMPPMRDADEQRPLA